MNRCPCATGIGCSPTAVPRALVVADEPVEDESNFMSKVFAAAAQGCTVGGPRDPKEGLGALNDVKIQDVAKFFLTTFPTNMCLAADCITKQILSSREKHPLEKWYGEKSGGPRKEGYN
eukprot:Skav231905  [mRNA]  locus=scaffold960:238229:242742:- [translate_table: standard]